MEECYLKYYHLLTKFNPAFISLKAQKMQDEINELYDLSVGTIKIDEVKGWYKGGWLVEDLAIRICEKKEQLDKFLKRAERDYEDFFEAADRAKPSHYLAVFKYQKTGKFNNREADKYNRFLLKLQEVREERTDKGYQCVEDYEELTADQVNILSSEIDAFTEYEIDYEAIKKQNKVDYWNIGFLDVETRKEHLEYKGRLKNGDPEAVKWFEHKEKFKKLRETERIAEYRASIKERQEKRQSWTEKEYGLINM
ncbi:hypothetical protein [Macrococcus bovicus]|uniref:Uncharacterized protein n=1 Tax=Macrococcus bovicus TaxID=69968 RepID=A0A4R6C2P7_9STAP|nr:hypothetical protein [Macrococcus bovicus]TDM15605.1 hypothetical protein ERX55_01485 [Macrococcus bovicus]